MTAAVDLLRTTERFERAGLVLDRTTLSPATRRAAFALQCQLAYLPEAPEPARPPIGFPYPRLRQRASRADS